MLKKKHINKVMIMMMTMSREKKSGRNEGRSETKNEEKDGPYVITKVHSLDIGLRDVSTKKEEA